MMRYISFLGLITLVSSLDQLSPFLVDDTSSLSFDRAELDLDPFLHNDAESDFSPFLDDDWSTAAPLEPGLDADLSNPIFDLVASDSTTNLSDDPITTDLGEDFSGDTIATAIQCPSTVAPSRRIRSREDQCLGPQPHEAQSPELQLQDESIKSQWCSLIPWLGFGNIPVARFTDSMMFPVPPDAVPNTLLSLVPLSGFFNVLRGALRKSIPPASLARWKERRPKRLNWKLVTHVIESLVHATDVWCCNVFIPDDSGFIKTPVSLSCLLKIISHSL